MPQGATKRDLPDLLARNEAMVNETMKQVCVYCERPFRDGDHVRAIVLSVYHEIPSARSYAIEKPYECESLRHIECMKGISL